MTSWEGSANWYDKTVGSKGHTYHQSIIIPNVLKFLGQRPESVIDFGCGQGVLARALPSQTEYCGIDMSPTLIKIARQYSKNRTFIVGDICKPLNLDKAIFTHAVFILSLQNIENPDKALRNAAYVLKKNGNLILVLNHPCFRIPRQSHWGVDLTQKVQFRRIDRYMSPLKIPISTHPGQKAGSPTTWSFHFPLSAYSKWLNESGFAILHLDEWISDKKSTGKKASMENKARSEIPLFLAIKAQKM